MLDQLTHDVFEPHIGTSFWAEFPNGTKVELRLDRVAKVMESELARLNRHPFSLFFIGPKSYKLKQQIYHLTHESLEAVDIFLVPVSESPEIYEYEAIFT